MRGRDPRRNEENREGSEKKLFAAVVLGILEQLQQFFYGQKSMTGQRRSRRTLPILLALPMKLPEFMAHTYEALWKRLEVDG